MNELLLDLLTNKHSITQLQKHQLIVFIFSKYSAKEFSWPINHFFLIKDKGGIHPNTPKLFKSSQTRQLRMTYFGPVVLKEKGKTQPCYYCVMLNVSKRGSIFNFIQFTPHTFLVLRYFADIFISRRANVSVSSTMGAGGSHQLLIYQNIIITVSARDSVFLE